MSHCTVIPVETDDSMPRAFPRDDPLSQGEKLAREEPPAAQIPIPALSAENQTKCRAIWSLYAARQRGTMDRTSTAVLRKLFL